MGSWTQMEEKIMDCWMVINDLRAVANKAEDSKTICRLNAMADLYDFKMEVMFDLFEDLLKENYELRQNVNRSLNKSDFMDRAIEDIAIEYADFGGDIPRDKWVPYARAIIAAYKEDTPW